MPTLPWMDSIRALACAAVIVWHGFLTIVPVAPTSGQQLVSLPLGAAAREAVVVFVLLSGYLLGRHWRGGFSRDDLGATFRTYMLRRTWRMVPAYWAALALAVLLMLVFGLDQAQGTHWDTGLPLTGWRVATDFLMISDVLGHVPVSHQLLDRPDRVPPLPHRAARDPDPAPHPGAADRGRADRPGHVRAAVLPCAVLHLRLHLRVLGRCEATGGCAAHDWSTRHA
ncbi:acyltransferase family protein [Aeromicrobium sp. UC242_57]|uniref:acyltransferase family protein n=1 Tax=Aeromicrobium sp. UC242_57 TaxID=3374624 RepID=UPI00378FE36F